VMSRHKKERGMHAPLFQKGAFIIGREYCYCIKGRQASSEKKQVKLPDEIVPLDEQSCRSRVRLNRCFINTIMCKNHL